MNIEESLLETLQLHLHRHETDVDFVKLLNVYNKLKSDGLLKLPEYDLPMMDTIGKYNSDSEHTYKSNI